MKISKMLKNEKYIVLVSRQEEREAEYLIEAAWSAVVQYRTTESRPPRGKVHNLHYRYSYLE